MPKSSPADKKTADRRAHPEAIEKRRIARELNALLARFVGPRASERGVRPRNATR